MLQFHQNAGESRRDTEHRSQRDQTPDDVKSIIE